MNDLEAVAQTLAQSAAATIKGSMILGPGFVYREILEALREIRAEALLEAGRVARDGCLVAPYGGSPTKDEVRLCNHIADGILRLNPEPSTDG
jgi:hypothetical protein